MGKLFCLFKSMGHHLSACDEESEHPESRYMPLLVFTLILGMLPH